jgi:hypothetical protein
MKWLFEIEKVLMREKNRAMQSLRRIERELHFVEDAVARFKMK